MPNFPVGFTHLLRPDLNAQALNHRADVREARDVDWYFAE
jgi:hypothetical protein